MLQSLLRAEEDDDEEENEVPDDEIINQMIARSGLDESASNNL